MGYITEKLTVEDCIKIQEDFSKKIPEDFSEFLKDLACERGAKYSDPAAFNTAFGEIYLENGWYIDRKRNCYSLSFIWEPGVKRVGLFVDGETFVLESYFRSDTLKPINIKDKNKLEIIKKEAESALDVMFNGFFHVRLYSFSRVSFRLAIRHYKRTSNKK